LRQRQNKENSFDNTTNTILKMFMVYPDTCRHSELIFYIWKSYGDV